jgi:hypothetical protein
LFLQRLTWILTVLAFGWWSPTDCVSLETDAIETLKQETLDSLVHLCRKPTDGHQVNIATGIPNRSACELHTGLLAEILTEFWTAVVHEKL